MDHTLPVSPALCPEIRLHLARDLEEIRAHQEDTLGRTGVGPAYWAAAWPGGEALARHLLDHPELVAGRRVLDLGAGSGLCAIAAALAGATRVEAADTDPCAVAAIAANAALNGVRVEAVAEDLVGSAPRWEVVLAADLWYERFFAARVTPWLRELAQAGVHVIVADCGRAFFPRHGLVRLAEHEVRPHHPEAGAVVKAGVWSMAASPG